MWLLFPESSPDGDPSGKNITRSERKTSCPQCPDCSPWPFQISLNICELKLKWTVTRLRRCRRRQYRKCFFVHLKVNRAITGQFTIELYGNVLLAAYAKLASLKIFNFRNADIGAEYNVMQIFEDLEKSQPFEHNHIK